MGWRPDRHTCCLQCLLQGINLRLHHLQIVGRQDGAVASDLLPVEVVQEGEVDLCFLQLARLDDYRLAHGWEPDDAMPRDVELLPYLVCMETSTLS